MNRKIFFTAKKMGVQRRKARIQLNLLTDEAFLAIQAMLDDGRFGLLLPLAEIDGRHTRPELLSQFCRSESATDFGRQTLFAAHSNLQTEELPIKTKLARRRRFPLKAGHV